MSVAGDSTAPFDTAPSRLLQAHRAFANLLFFSARLHTKRLLSNSFCFSRGLARSSSRHGSMHAAQIHQRSIRAPYHDRTRLRFAATSRNTLALTVTPSASTLSLLYWFFCTSSPVPSSSAPSLWIMLMHGPHRRSHRRPRSRSPYPYHRHRLNSATPPSYAVPLLIGLRMLVSRARAMRRVDARLDDSFAGGRVETDSRELGWVGRGYGRLLGVCLRKSERENRR
ncbi:hypothetical protein R3P38DRAFT_3278275, partial [Favolaschia claudopus]